MSEHTPELGEARNLYADGLIAFWGSHDTLIRRSEAVAEFDRFINKVKADALREAAETFDARLPDGTGNGRAYNSYRVAELLKARANEIEREA